MNRKTVLNFDVIMPTTEGILFCMRLKRDGVESSLSATKMDRAHELLRYGGEHTTR